MTGALRQRHEAFKRMRDIIIGQPVVTVASLSLDSHQTNRFEARQMTTRGGEAKSLTQKLPSRESSDPQLDSGQRDKGRKGLSKVFIILGEAAVPSEPREGAFHDPAPG